MATRQVEVCDVEISGVVQSVGRGKRDDGSYLRFMGAHGEVAVLVPDDVLNGRRCPEVGERVSMACDVVTRRGPTGEYTLITAYSVHTGGKPEKAEKAV